MGSSQDRACQRDGIGWDPVKTGLARGDGIGWDLVKTGLARGDGIVQDGCDGAGLDKSGAPACDTLLQTLCGGSLL